MGHTTRYAYDSAGNLVTTTFPDGTTTTASYDAANRKVAETDQAGKSTQFAYDPHGKLTSVTDAEGGTVSYTYDAVYRLIAEAIDEPGTAGDQTITYTYDAVGNRTQMNRDGAVTTYTYDANDRLLTETTGGTTATHTYDANGNLISRTVGTTTDTYTYDGENRLVEADLESGINPVPVSYTYDTDGMRTSKTAGGVTTTFLVDKNRALAQVVAETTGAVTTHYTYGNQLVSQTRTGGGTRFYLTDGQLSTRQLTTTAGAVSDTYTYDAFGVTLAATGTTPNAYLYTGEQLDANIGFYYLRARYYSQAQGRFITTDPAAGNIFEPASLHRYLYANADPVNRSDPSGMLPQVAAIVAVIWSIVAILDTAIGLASSAVTFLVLKGNPFSSGKKFETFAVEVLAGGLGGFVSTFEGIGPFVAGLVAVAKYIFIQHYIVKADIFNYDVIGQFTLQVFVSGIFGFGLQASTFKLGQAGSQAVISTGGTQLLRFFGAKFGFVQSVTSGGLEEGLGATIGGSKGDYFWCSFDYVPYYAGDCEKRRKLTAKLKGSK